MSQELSRRKARENAFLALFSTSFGSTVDESLAAAAEVEEYAVDGFGEGLLRLYEANAAEIDGQIERRLKGWRVQRLPRVSLAVLRLAVAEMLYGEPDMESIVINEAVELAKKYGDEQDYQFINGVLGTIARSDASEKPEKSVPEAPPAEG